MTIPELIEILKAAEAGKVIQWQGETTKIWSPLSEQSAVNIARNVAENFNLRVKPEPREWWLSIDVNGNPGAPCATLELAARWTSGSRQPIHVREVIDP